MTEEPARTAIEESLRLLGIEPTPELVDSAVQDGDLLLPVDPSTGERVAVSDEAVVAALQKAHQDADKYTALLATAREQRRLLTGLLRARGHSFRWIGDQLQITPQAVDSFVKYRQRRQRTNDGA